MKFGVELLNTRENGCMISGCDQKTAEAFKQQLAQERRRDSCPVFRFWTMRRKSQTIS